MLILNLFNRSKGSNKKIVLRTLYTEKDQKHIPCSFAYKFVCVDEKFSKPVALYREKNGINRFIEVILEKYDYCQKVKKNILIRT